MTSTMWVSLVCVLTLWTAVESNIYAGQFYPQYQPYQPWLPNQPYNPPPKPIIPKRPLVPGSPQWKKMEFIKQYQADQRSRTSDVRFGPKSKAKTSFEQIALQHHNIHRRLHQVRDLTLDHKMSQKAARYAFKIAKDMRIAHSRRYDRPQQGESIAVGCKASGPGLSAFEAVKYWYQTVCNHNWYSPQPNEKSRPFTNMIWKNSKKFGIGYASFKTKDKFNCTVVVARYTPEGSKGQDEDYKSNVIQGLFIPTSCQYVNDRDKPEFIQPALENCKTSKDFHGQMVEKESSCTFNQLFSAFGASRRKGKLAFRVVL